MYQQQSLFSKSTLRELERPYGSRSTPMTFSATMLQAWKQRIYRFQQTVLADRSQPLQGSILETDALWSTLQQLDPFSLPQQNTEFWRGSFPDPGTAAYYFVTDMELPLLLYVGETCQSNQRWKGEHDCKGYLFNYVALHRRYDQAVSVRIGFCFEAPKATRHRQRLEQQLIQHWRSPFNKENWRHWGTPFASPKT
ncbi:GIY-YIG nuclease family protein [Lyngbya confervoides]|uniref:GIY-YIG nuclease family protein n=1 Tax=Lyngbya confervoides BDU141951 TaxID=1574623 RepID=A0ABD4T4P2_9CYAN|nr:GIY-YIG nuclease family protein [Lyngbya confervoides]MCM1983611.1 GIY-YIG nuclease family protein [Lyngbya confervoides BDU141951]